MKNLSLFLAGFFLGVLSCRADPKPTSRIAIDVEEMASPSFFRRTTLLRLDPVPEGSPQTPP